MASGGAPSPPPRRSYFQSPNWGIVPILLAQAVLVGWYIYRSWFFVDDFLFLKQGRDSNLSWRYLSAPLFEHFSPVHRHVYTAALGFGYATRALAPVLDASCSGRRNAARAALRVMIGLDRPPFGEPPNQAIPTHRLPIAR